MNGFLPKSWLVHVPGQDRLAALPASDGLVQASFRLLHSWLDTLDRVPLPPDTVPLAKLALRVDALGQAPQPQAGEALAISPAENARVQGMATLLRSWGAKHGEDTRPPDLVLLTIQAPPVNDRDVVDDSRSSVLSSDGTLLQRLVRLLHGWIAKIGGKETSPESVRFRAWLAEAIANTPSTPNGIPMVIDDVYDQLQVGIGSLVSVLADIIIETCTRIEEPGRLSDGAHI
jgi:hypothetical protein